MNKMSKATFRQIEELLCSAVFLMTIEDDDNPNLLQRRKLVEVVERSVNFLPSQEKHLIRERLVAVGKVLKNPLIN